MKIKKIISLAVLCMIVAAAILVAINRNTYEQADNKLTVSASFYPLYEFAQQVGGDKVSVTNITPAGTEPHSFEPSAKTLVAAQKSDVFVYNGGDFEPWSDKFLASYANTAVQASKNVALHHDEASHDDSHDDHHQGDPHFWLDPVLAQTIILNIRDGFIKAQPENKAYFTEKATQYIQKLQDLDADYKQALANCNLDTVVASHSSLNYLGERYGFTTLPISGVSTETEPSSADMAHLTEVVKEKAIPYILFETLVSPRIADTIAQETGAQTAVFNPLEGLTGDEQQQGKNYYNVQQQNIKTLRAALACR